MDRNKIATIQAAVDQAAENHQTTCECRICQAVETGGGFLEFVPEVERGQKAS